MSHVWNRSLATQLIAFTLAALLVSQALTFLISWKEHSRALDAAAKSEFLSRARTMTRLVETVPAEYQRQALLASETSDSRFWVTDREAEDAGAWRQTAAAEFSRPLENFVDLVRIFQDGSARTQIPDAKRVAVSNLGEGWRVPMQSLWALPQPIKYIYFDGSRGYGLVIKVDDRTWLNAAFYMRQTGGWWTSTSLASLCLTAVVLALIGVFFASRISRPLRQLAASAEALGRGENLPPISEEGPEEVRRTAEAFNKMQSRLHRFVEDRTKMLAAIGHDLRTPLTTLRLRTEFVTDEEIQRKMLSTIDELQAMTEAAISFARGESTEEETRDIDLEALVGSICDDQSDLGQPVDFVEGAKLTYRCRPDGLRRAVRNLVENAIRYGGEARVFIRPTAATVDIIVEDRGPGIPEPMQEKVFAPFFRLEGSRNRDTGGIGLGLSIARAVARQHGGDISFITRNGGMQAVLSLPRDGRVEPSKVKKGRDWKLLRGSIGSRTQNLAEKQSKPRTQQ
ncbi:signal transduction histidine kinase [Rhizobium sp. BK196]|uniref:ATP-binding protein n=1 Tax=unclassified Rhizobium TaxID=2613769 RepID=UPI0016229BAA|nr:MULTISPECIES: ATP-binding protein [unclassified Rhizobium]MBB3314024.1 signal transduction histidine kinase [Rhizobium sp. BK196]MBB3464242.1 signal transduction histidine kinase [Rhizobium sp. BK377]